MDSAMAEEKSIDTSVSILVLVEAAIESEVEDIISMAVEKLSQSLF
ncbi:MAG: hypothetical protein ACPK85_11450 [Methanosarcina sp.]